MNNKLVVSNIKEVPGYNPEFTVLPAEILEEMYVGDTDYEKIQKQIKSITIKNLRETLQENLNQYKVNATQYSGKFSSDISLKDSDEALKNKNIIPFENVSLLPRISGVIVKDNVGYFQTVAYMAYSNINNQNIANDNKNVVGISVYNEYPNGQINPLYISSRQKKNVKAENKNREGMLLKGLRINK